MSSFQRMLAAAACLLIGVLTCEGRGTDGPQNNVILFGWDGAQREHVKECLGRGELPVLQSIAAQGSIVEIDVLRVTDTKAGWSQILTGCNPETSGVFSNGRYGPIPAGLTIFERLEDYFGKDNITTVAVIGKKGHVDADGRALGIRNGRLQRGALRSGRRRPPADRDPTRDRRDLPAR